MPDAARPGLGTMVVLWCSLGGCVSNTITLESEPTSTTDDATATTTPETRPPPSTSGTPPVSTASTSVGDVTTSPTDPTFTDGSESGDPLGQPCELLLQDCPTGYKCMPYDSRASESVWWDDVACFPVDPAPHGLGEPCAWSEAPWSGLDDCGPAQVCWSPAELLDGTCKNVCVLGEDGTPSCTDPAESPLVPCPECFCVCETPCDPVYQSCADGPNTCPGAAGGEECLPLYLDPSMIPAGLEHVGLCGAE